MIDTVNRLDSLAGVVILAGGASSRMGTPKAELILPTGERLIDYHVRHALNLNTPIMIADNGRGFCVESALKVSNSQASIIHIADYGADHVDGQNSNSQIDTGGALVAIESALQTMVNTYLSDALVKKQSSWLLVISCDSLISAIDLWQKLQSSAMQATDSQATESETTDSQAVDKKVICLTDDSHLYPLLGLYQLSVEPDLKAYIDSGQRRVMQFIKPIVQAVPFEKNWQHLTNFNTPEEFKRACASLSDL
ncbi:NTP transferase domain-containing protein [Psychrobacter sp. P11G5]|uniref:molybdenum cofactor guanylyltransferase n=1 Tax=Psychrobacter sp. P11G5 TaxID=1699624 RepID=UPI00078EA860|nr:NTP transferase domain-containing protein [Psychrobacter sp. P11G5]AMN68081.1 molybdenum cofactor guanylyltransferase [Psychrobacter sp. P11G5]